MLMDPSHLGEAGKEQKLRDAIAAGMITEQDVKGNNEADKLAKSMLRQEELPARVLQRKRDR